MGEMKTLEALEKNKYIGTSFKCTTFLPLPLRIRQGSPTALIVGTTKKEEELFIF
jgi:hypothetical protein